MEKRNAHSTPSASRPSGRMIAGWVFVAIGMWMAFSTAATTADEGLRMMMLIAGSFLAGGLVFDVTRWLVRRNRPPSDE
ncbi:hypothetical protein [Microbacterium sp. K41]|uniref:hypothetical protein n=1 Tax=Microbacterium sp. K41 TaxID=2305437 RepID=UPI00109C3534|nr:hypothetical protein [Microbacterium sp. K41]